MNAQTKKHIKKQFGLFSGLYSLNQCIRCFSYHIPWMNVRRVGIEVREIPDLVYDRCGFFRYEAEFPKLSFETFLHPFSQTHAALGFGLLSNTEFMDETNRYLGFMPIECYKSIEIVNACRSGIVASSHNIGSEFEPVFFSTSDDLSSNANHFWIQFYVSEKFVNSYDMNDLILYNSITTKG